MLLWWLSDCALQCTPNAAANRDGVEHAHVHARTICAIPLSHADASSHAAAAHTDGHANRFDDADDHTDAHRHIDGTTDRNSHHRSDGYIDPRPDRDEHRHENIYRHPVAISDQHAGPVSNADGDEPRDSDTNVNQHNI